MCVVSQRAPYKGIALRAELVRLKCDRVVDDKTDEDVFSLTDDRLSLFAIRVGRKNHSRAGYFLRNREEIDELLHLLLRLPSIS